MSMRAVVLAFALALAPFACDRSSAPAPPPSSVGAPSIATSASAPPPSSEPHPGRKIPVTDTAAGITYIHVVTAGASAADTLPMIVWLHGRGDRPERAIAMLGSFDSKVRFIIPRAIHGYGNGYSWFDYSAQKPTSELAAALRDTASKVVALLEELKARYPTKGKPILAGFSQGGMLTMTAWALRPDVLDEGVAVGGTLPPALWPSARDASSVPPLVILHGDRDDVVPIEPTRAFAGRMRAQNLPVTMKEYPGVPHTITSPMLSAIEQAFVSQIAR